MHNVGPGGKWSVGIYWLVDGGSPFGEGQDWMADGAMSGRQCLAARTGLGWKQADLANRASVSRGTIAAIEDGKGKVLANNRNAVISAFLAEGVVFTSDETKETVTFLFSKP